MQHELREDWGPLAMHAGAEPRVGSRVGWGSVVAGTVALLAVSLILSGLALAIVSVTTRPMVPSLKTGAIVLWVCAIVATLVGAFVGGWLAGYLPGRVRTGTGVMHGFLAWSLALVLTVGFQVFAFRGMLGALVNTAVESAAVASTVAESVGPPQLGDRSDPPARSEAAAAGRTALDYVAGFGWSWFGTWFVAGIITMAGAAAGVRRTRRRESLYEGLRPRDTEEGGRPTGPLTTAPTA